MSSLAQPGPTFHKDTLEIPSATPEWNLDVWRFMPQNDESNNSPVPVIIMAHGFSANKLMCLSEYAEAFAELGYACIVFDFRRWGASGGYPRHTIVVSEQLDDYRTVIKYCRQQPEFDPQRIILWGSSFSGGHAITLAAESNLNIRAAIAQCPWTGIGFTPPFNLSFLKTVGYAIIDVLKQAVGLSPVYIPVVADPADVGILTPPGAASGMASIVKNKSDYPNEVSASSLFELPFYKPTITAKDIHCPLLVIASKSDNLCLIQGAYQVVREALEATFIQLDGAHFDLFPGNTLYQASINAQIEFLARNVPI